MRESEYRKFPTGPLPSFLRSREGWANYLEMKRSPEPHLHQIELTNACKYSCIMCPRGSKMTRQVGFMTMDLFTKVIDEISTYSADVKAKEIELFHFGESLLHPHVSEMADYATKAGLKTVLSVNAPELTPDLAERLLSAGVSKIIFSLDGYDEESYRTIRGTQADYALAVEHIKRAAALSKKMSSPTRLLVRMIELNANRAHVESFTNYWEKLGIETVIREFFPWNDPEMAELGSFDQYPPFMPCPFPWQYLVVQWNGDVVACCRDYNGINTMGNARTTTLKEIWNSDTYRVFRQQMESGHYTNSICPPCMALYYKEE